MSRRKGRRAGVSHRSGYEAAIRADLDARGISYEYEPAAFVLMLRGSNHVCATCGSHRTNRKVRYTPDFAFPNGCVVEAKGKFTARDRKIAEAWVDQYRSRPFRMLFQRDNKLARSSSTRYSDWCEARTIEYAIGTKVPVRWTR